MGTLVESTVEGAGWSPLRRIMFRFVFVYLFVYIASTILQFLSLAAASGNIDVWNRVVPWVGQHVFQVEITVRPGGSGDTTYNYVQVFCFLVLATTASTAWTLCDRQRRSYERLDRGLRVFVRFTLALVMILYGSVKVIKTQFPDPGLVRLVQPFGDASPMGLLWTFMGASQAYTVFTGAAEMLGGLLLTTRRTTLLGALVCVAVLGNVVMLNFCYDVPVKLLSSHLFLMALYVMAPDVQRLGNLFLLGRPAEAVDSRPLFERRWLHRGVLVLRTVLIAGFTILLLRVAYVGRTEHGDQAPKPPLYGLWEVDEFEVDGKARPPLLTDATRWRRLIFNAPGSLSIQLMDQSRERYRLTLDQDGHTLMLKKLGDSAWEAPFTYEEPAAGRLTLQGTFEGRPVRALCHRVDESKFLLTNRGFHWISEEPFNR